MTTFLNQNLLGIKVVKAFVREKEQSDQFKVLSDNLYEKFVETGKVSAASNKAFLSG